MDHAKLAAAYHRNSHTRRGSLAFRPERLVGATSRPVRAVVWRAYAQIDIADRGDQWAAALDRIQSICAFIPGLVSGGATGRRAWM
jgi:hypothetical protein